ncbi:hypothetical protein C9F11_13245 [Streptomyces sp. YIM 121038]|uniref:hypothetical protein n=1 Tax=Streptomyces sp. YIM 121038 TaxID=2136401 RepID=UPI0011101758|nr:hypothetical protein [Streptomyces sp. YIM 121038]QCX76326.1 hypothetical protein C9F11_13245 [Streptomyces sp. YIM 121038]
MNKRGILGKSLLTASCVILGPALTLAPAAHADSDPAPTGATKVSSRSADKPDDDVTPKVEGTTRIQLNAPSTDGHKKTIRAYCNITADTPHWSKKGMSVIYKTRAQCYGNVPSVQLKVTSKLMRAGAPKPLVAATAKETQTVRAGGGKATFYAPVPNGKKVKYSARFWGRSTAQIVSPIVGTKTQVVSKTADLKPK